MRNLESFYKQIRNATYLDENECVSGLLKYKYLSEYQQKSITDFAEKLIKKSREDKSQHTMLDAFLMEFGLSNQEGVALMCIAESLLRVPDNQNADRLIAEKIKSGKWTDHLGNSDSIFVNASTWGLMLTGFVVELDDKIRTDTKSWIKRFSSRLSEPIVRKAVSKAMKIMANQYVLGQTIDDALKRKSQRNLFSFDMLGEGSRTEFDSVKYFNEYSNAIEEIGILSKKNCAVEENDGISVKLSALYNRFEYKQREGVFKNLYPKIKSLCLQAKKNNISLSIDAEESDRLELAMQIFAKLAKDRDLDGWNGLGFVLQAYLKRAPIIIKWLYHLSDETHRRFLVRLVKGAYWDTEIKIAQEKGLQEYPVFTRKFNTDLCYHHCAHLLSKYQDHLYPQFATHNAYTVAFIYELYKGKRFEYQRLHGMGEILYFHLNDLCVEKFKARVYAPVGHHDDLLPYLVRRLLENGANSSFVNRFLDEKEPIENLAQDPVKKISKLKSFRNPKIELPRDIHNKFSDSWLNSIGINTQNHNDLKSIKKIYEKIKKHQLYAHSVLNGKAIQNDVQTQLNPFNSTDIGSYSLAKNKDLDALEAELDISVKTFKNWGLSARITALEKMAILLEKNVSKLSCILTIEAGRTIDDSHAEVREAADFCRYYALQAQKIPQYYFNDKASFGLFLCISPWNFPLAIFTGQIAAAILMGNVVIAKPAEQTPQIASQACKLFYQAGVPSDILHLLLADGAKTSALIKRNIKIDGIAFTGSNRTAYKIQETISKKSYPVSFIAETGGQNCMIVDSTALPEQVVDDVVISAFSSAGQRCSSLRVLYLQEDTADEILTMLEGAIQSLNLGDPSVIETDIGPLIDAVAVKRVKTHIAYMKKTAKLITKKNAPNIRQKSLMVEPHVFEIEDINVLEEEIFGPVLHVIRYRQKNIETVIKQVNSTGYFLTIGVHSRIKAFADYIFENTHHGNFYINRNMIGATVGVNPFGGSQLSGTGPKAGGPYYIHAFSAKKIHGECENYSKKGFKETKRSTVISSDKINFLFQLANQQRKVSISNRINSKIKEVLPQSILELIVNLIDQPKLLNSPTGESNFLSFNPRGLIIFIPHQKMKNEDVAKNISVALMCGCPVILLSDDSLFDIHEGIINEFIASSQKNLLLHEKCSCLRSLISNRSLYSFMIDEDHELASFIKNQFALRYHGIVNIIPPQTDFTAVDASWLLNFLSERTLTENLVASGGNTQLFNLVEDPEIRV